MASNDPRGDLERFQNELDRVREADIPKREREAVLAFGRHKDETNAKSTATGQLGHVRCSAEMAAALDMSPLIEWQQGDYERFVDRLRNADVPDWFLRHVGDEGWGEGSLRNFRNALKQFLLYLDDRADDDRVWTDSDRREWVNDIKVGAPAKPKVNADDLLGPDELAAMWSAIDGLRDRVLFAVTYCTWQRNAVIRSFRVGDVEVHNGGIEGVVRIYEEALGRKGASGRKPLSWAVGPVHEWLEIHPNGEDPSAPLICVTRDAGDAEEGAPLSAAESVNRRLRKWAKRGGLDRDRWDRSHGRRQRTVRAHLLRYTGATRAAKSDEFSESTVKQWGGWTQGSDQLNRYIQLTDEDVLASWAMAHDINSAAFEADHPEFGTCSRCDGPVEDWLPTCPACGHDVGEAAPETGPSLEEELGQALNHLVRNDPDAARELIDIVEDIGPPVDG